MKILFAFAKAFTFTYFEEVIKYLHNQNHNVEIIHGYYAKLGGTERSLEMQRKELGLKTGALLLRKKWTSLIYNLREINNFATYLQPNYPTNSWLKDRGYGDISIIPRFFIKQRFVQSILALPKVRDFLLSLENWIPADTNIIKHLQALKPAVVVASPYIYGHAREIEYIKAAKTLNIPTIALLQSWDNLTTKGTFLIAPDYIFVWNERLVKEAIQLHQVPREKLIVTGAPKFDIWFDMQPSCSREDFCKQIGAKPEAPILTYLCSSLSIAGDETIFIQKFIETFTNHPKTKGATLLVRPYPSNAGIWKNFSVPNVIIWPPEGEIPDTKETRLNYYNTLSQSVAVIGVNTSAFLEAAIVDRPCVSIVTDHYRLSQQEMPHFSHLVDGDFMEIATSFNQAAEILGEICHGRDAKALQRRKFVESFIRPHGLTKSASQITADLILNFSKPYQI